MTLIMIVNNSMYLAILEIDFFFATSVFVSVSLTNCCKVLLYVKIC